MTLPHCPPLQSFMIVRILYCKIYAYWRLLFYVSRLGPFSTIRVPPAFWHTCPTISPTLLLRFDFIDIFEFAYWGHKKNLDFIDFGQWLTAPTFGGAEYRDNDPLTFGLWKIEETPHRDCRSEKILFYFGKVEKLKDCLVLECRKSCQSRIAIWVVTLLIALLSYYLGDWWETYLC